MTSNLPAAALAATLALAGVPAVAQSFEFIGGLRQIGSNDRLGYAGLTYRFAGAGQDGAFVRSEVEVVSSGMFGPTLRQQTFRLLGGYSWMVAPGASVAVFAGPTHVTRRVAGVELIGELGYVVGAEAGGFVGARGFVGGIAQYSSPDRAAFARGFASYYLNDRFGMGPDLSYQSEPDFSRLSAGVRFSYVAGASIWGVTLGQARSRATGLPTHRGGLAEVQLIRSF